MFDFSKMMTDHVGRFTIGFVGTDKDHAFSLGSGTLARHGSVGGVITCAHVIEKLKGEIGIVCFSTRPDELQTIKIEMSATEKLIVGSPTGTEFGPDLAFLRLPDAKLVELERLGSVINGARRRENALAGEPNDSVRVNLVCGVIDECTTVRTEG